MDRLFIYENAFYDDISNPDGCLIKNALQQFTKRNCDAWCEMHLAASADSPLFRLMDTFQTNVKFIPIGSIEFIQKFLSYQKKDPKFTLVPLEIPISLQPFLHHQCWIKKGKEFNKEECSGKFFVKDIDHIKSFNSSLLKDCWLKEYLSDECTYSISEFVTFDSEWRVFVFQDEVLGLYCYQGEPLLLPDNRILHHMISAYASERHPQAYTLDVGVRIHKNTTGENFTEPIEVHPFAGVGLYGFYSKDLLDMWDAGYRWYWNQGSNQQES